MTYKLSACTFSSEKHAIIVQTQEFNKMHPRIFKAPNIAGFKTFIKFANQ
jgi:hypothetical protein